VFAVAGVVVTSAAPGGAAADEPGDAADTMRFAERDGAIVATGSVSKVFDVGAYDRLENALQQTVVIRIWVYPEDRAEATGFVLLKHTCVYDLWDEIYECATAGPSGRRVHRVKFRAAAFALLTNLDQIPIAPSAKLVFGETYAVALVAELNPVSKETLAEVRRWLSQGSGGGLDRGGSFFGTFVSVFVNLKVPEADRVIRRAHRFRWTRGAP
jgi:hypothetical protein